MMIYDSMIRYDIVSVKYMLWYRY